MSVSPLPELDWSLTEAFWLAAKNGKFVLPRCSRCERYVWYPEARCPHCDGCEVPWVEVSGRGQLYSFAQVRHRLHPPYADQLPYVTGLVAVEEDPRVRYVTRIVDCSPSELEIEMPVEVVFRALSFSGIEGSVIAPLFRSAR